VLNRMDFLVVVFLCYIIDFFVISVFLKIRPIIYKTYFFAGFCLGEVFFSTGVDVEV
jgi:hypothetical protein